MEKSREVELCDTGLSLELGIGGKSTTWSMDHRSMAQRQASLTLSLSDEGCGGEAVQEAEAYKGCVEGGQLRPSSPLSHSTVSSFSAAYPPTIKKEKEVVGGEEAEVELATFRGARDDDNDGSGRKKLRLTKEQSAMLEDRFKEHSNLNPKQKHALAKQLNLRPRQVEVWFQNRRARTKLKQTEVDRELLKRCCESLTVENRRLRKELQELKALKFTPPLYMQLPAATLTMCPSCNRVGGSADSCNSGGAEEFAAAPSTPRFFNPFIHSATC